MIDAQVAERALYDGTIEDIARLTTYVVEASSLERMYLTQEYLKAGLIQPITRTSCGWMRSAGTFAGHDVVIVTTWVLYQSPNDSTRVYPVCFWQATSKVVNYDLIDTYLKSIFPPGVTLTDTLNFRPHL